MLRAYISFRAKKGMEEGMIARLFSMHDDDAKVLQKIGAAFVLHWSEVPKPLQETIVHQVQAMDGSLHPRAVRASLEKMIGKSNEQR